MFSLNNAAEQIGKFCKQWHFSFSWEIQKHHCQQKFDHPLPVLLVARHALDDIGITWRIKEINKIKKHIRNQHNFNNPLYIEKIIDSYSSTWVNNAEAAYPKIFTTSSPQIYVVWNKSMSLRLLPNEIFIASGNAYRKRISREMKYYQ